MRKIDRAAREIFVQFVKKALDRRSQELYIVRSNSRKGQAKILTMICHEFDEAVLANAWSKDNYDKVWDKPCFVFSEGYGFGVPFSTVREAYDDLGLQDGWLILLADASAGIFNPHDRTDSESLIVPKP